MTPLYYKLTLQGMSLNIRVPALDADEDDFKLLVTFSMINSIEQHAYLENSTDISVITKINKAFGFSAIAAFISAYLLSSKPIVGMFCLETAPIDLGIEYRCHGLQNDSRSFYFFYNRDDAVLSKIYTNGAEILEF